MATIVTGRAIPGTTLPILLAGDIFAVIWYGHHTRWDLLRPMIISVSVGFTAGATFFAVVGSSTRPIEIVIGLSILLMAVMQAWRMVHRHRTGSADARRLRLVYGSSGGFTTFVANAAGPILNTYLIRLGLGKDETGRHVGVVLLRASTSPRSRCTWPWGMWPSGGPFFTGSHAAFDAVLFPALSSGCSAVDSCCTSCRRRLSSSAFWCCRSAGGDQAAAGRSGDAIDEVVQRPGPCRR